MTQATVTTPRASLRSIAVMVSVILAGTVYEINITIVTVALPYMQGTFAATHDQISWVVTSFVLGMTAQTSDVEISGQRIRRSALVHSIV